MAALNSQDNCGLLDQSIPQWKRELILKRRAQGRALQAGIGSVKLTCPTTTTTTTTTANTVGRSIESPSSSAAGASADEAAVVSGKQRQWQQQRSSGSSSSVVVVSSKSSLDQNESDFHPGPGSSSAAGSVSNMRLVDQRLEGGNDLVGSVGVSSKVMLDSVVDKENCALKFISRMGEEKSIIIKPPGANTKSIMDKYNVKRKHHKPVVGVCENKIITSTNGNEDECLSDSSEELQYGPGIVNKLKTKYLSMTLRENQKRGVRPSLSNLRRATSLENMLEEDAKTPQTITVSRKNAQAGVNSKPDDKYNSIKLNKTTTTISYPYGYKSLSSRRGLDSMKRACSMDTLLRSDTKPVLGLNHNHLSKSSIDKELLNGNKSKISIANEDIIIVENSSNDTNGKFHEDSKTLVNNKILNIEEKELPPPDVVKQTLKKFENAPNVKAKTTFSVTNKNRTSQNAKPYRTSGISNNNTNSVNDKSRVIKPLLSPKPVLSPEKNCSQNRSIKVSSPKRMNLKKNEENIIASRQQLSSPIEPKEVLTDDCVVVTPCDKKPQISSKIATQSVSPVVHVVSNSDSVISNPPPVANRTVSPESDTPVLNGKLESALPASVSEEQVNTILSDDECTDGIITKSVSETALENIRKGGTSVKFSFKSDDSDSSGSKAKSYLPGAKDHPQATNTTLLANQPSPVGQFSSKPIEKTQVRISAPLLKHTEPSVTQMRQVGVIRPILTTKLQQSPHIHHHTPPVKQQSPSVLTDLEIEKNLINCVKSIEQPVSKVVVAIKNLPDAVVVGSVPADLMSNKNLALPRVSSGGEMKNQGLWDKKPWHQNQNTMIFNFSDRKDVPDYIENDGLILRGKRELPRPGEGGIILLDGEGGGGLESSTDTDANDWAALRDSPITCDICFENDNVLINGKSNLRKHPKQKKLRIQFNDEPTTFEYPSESSFIIDSTDGESEGVHQSMSSSPSQSSSPSLTPASHGPVSGLPAAPLGGSSLASYTPSKLGEAEGWQPGITRHTPNTPPAGTQSPNTNSSSADDQATYLKPATPEQTVTWSEGTTADLLF